VSLLIATIFAVDIRRRLDLGVAEAVEGERRLEVRLLVVREDIAVGCLGGAERANVERPIRFEDLGVADRHRLAAPAADVQPDESGEVLAAVDGEPGRGAADDRRREDRDGTDRRCDPRLDERGVERDRPPAPRRLRRSRATSNPAGPRGSRRTPVVDVGRADLTSGRAHSPSVTMRRNEPSARPISSWARSATCRP
jgi:hypothetical protein